MGLFRNKINNYSELSTELKESNVNFDITMEVLFLSIKERIKK